MSLKPIFREFSICINSIIRDNNYQVLQEHPELQNTMNRPHLEYRYIDITNEVLRCLPEELNYHNKPPIIYCLVDQFNKYYKVHIVGFDCRTYNDIGISRNGDYRYNKITISYSYASHSDYNLDFIFEFKQISDTITRLEMFIVGHCLHCGHEWYLAHSIKDFTGINPNNYETYERSLKDFWLSKNLNIESRIILPVENVSRVKCLETIYIINGSCNLDSFLDYLTCSWLKSNPLEGDSIQLIN